MLLWWRDGQDDLVSVAGVFLLVELMGLLVTRQAQGVVRGMMVSVMVIVVVMPFTLSAIFLRCCPAVPEVPRHPSSSRAEEQRVHDGTGHQLDDPGWCRLFLAGAAWPRSLAGCGAMAIGSSGRYRK